MPRAACPAPDFTRRLSPKGTDFLERCLRLGQWYHPWKSCRPEPIVDLPDTTSGPSWKGIARIKQSSSGRQPHRPVIDAPLDEARASVDAP